MKYTYEMSREVKAMVSGDRKAFYKFYLMTVNDIYFHVKLVLRQEADTEQMVISIYRSLYRRMDQLDRPENTINWMNRIIYNKLNEWVFANCTGMLMQEDEGKFDNLVFNEGYIYSENMLTEAETANLAGQFIPELSPIHAIASLAYYYDNISTSDIATMLDCDEVRINTRTRYARKVIESSCMDYAREKILDIKRVDVHLLLLAYVSLAKTYGVSDIEALYRKVEDSIA